MIPTLKEILEKYKDLDIVINPCLSPTAASGLWKCAKELYEVLKTEYERQVRNEGR